jgi:hypothetical protein
MASAPQSRRGRSARKAVRGDDSGTHYAVTLRDYLDRRDGLVDASLERTPTPSDAGDAAEQQRASLALAQHDLVHSDIATARATVNDAYRGIMPVLASLLPGSKTSATSVGVVPKPPQSLRPGTASTTLPPTAARSTHSAFRSRPEATSKPLTSRHAGPVPMHMRPAGSASASRGPPNPKLSPTGGISPLETIVDNSETAARSQGYGSNAVGGSSYPDAHAAELARLQAVASEGFRDFRSAVRCTEMLLDEIDVSASHDEETTVRAVWDLLDRVVLASSVPNDLWQRVRAPIQRALFDPQGDMYRTQYRDTGRELTSARRDLQRALGVLPRVDRFFTASMAAREKLALRKVLNVWRTQTQQRNAALDRVSALATSTESRIIKTSAFLRWRRYTATTKRRIATDEASNARLEARQAKSSLTQAVNRAREESTRELHRVQVKFEDEKACREAQFTSLSSEIQSLSTSLRQAQLHADKCEAERDLWRLCWKPIGESCARRSVPGVPAVLLADGRRVKQLLTALHETEPAQLLAALSEHVGSHRSVSRAGPAHDILASLGALRESVHDMLVHWTNLQLGELGCDRSLLTLDDLRDGELLGTLIDGVAAMAPPTLRLLDASPRRDVCHRFLMLCSRHTHLPCLQTLIAFCPYVTEHLISDRFLDPAEPGWFYWVLATLMTIRCTQWTVEDLELPSELHITARHPPEPSAVLRRPLAPAVIAGLSHSPSPASLRGSRRSTARRSAGINRAASFASKAGSDAGAPPLGGSVRGGSLRGSPSAADLLATAAQVQELEDEVRRLRDAQDAEAESDLRDAFLRLVGPESDPGRELDVFTTDQGRRRTWHGLVLLMGSAVLEYNCLEFDPQQRSFRHSLPAVAASTMSALAEMAATTAEDLLRSAEGEHGGDRPSTMRNAPPTTTGFLFGQRQDESLLSSVLMNEGLLNSVVGRGTAA